MLDKLPVCIIESSKYLAPVLSPGIKIRKNFPESFGFFIYLPETTEVHIVTTAYVVSESPHIYLEVHDTRGNWIRCEAEVKSFYGSVDFATLKLKESDENSIEFMKIARERALPLFPNQMTLQAILELDAFLPVETKSEKKLLRVELQGLLDTNIDFSEHVYVNLVYNRIGENHPGSPCIVIVDKQPYILGIHQSVSENFCTALPWFLMSVLLQADIQNRKVKGLCTPLFNCQTLENKVARKCNGLKKEDGGVRIKKIYPESRLSGYDVKVGDILLTVNGEKVSSSGLIYDPTLDYSFHYSVMHFTAAMPSISVELEFGRPHPIDLVSGTYALDRFTVSIVNDRTLDDISFHKDIKDYRILAISGFQFFSSSRYAYASSRYFHPEKEENHFRMHLRKQSSKSCAQAVIVGIIPEIQAAEGYKDFAWKRVARVDGLPVRDFAEFEQHIGANLAKAESGVLLTVADVNWDNPANVDTDDDQGNEMYIKHQSFEENKRISEQFKIPFKFFVQRFPAREEPKSDLGCEEQSPTIEFSN